MITKPIVTNIITGFLGAGKTTLISQLLDAKPQGETWAVLVNEFGEVGIDAALLGGEVPGIRIREVAGGCICCAAGVPTQVAINQLIAKARPDRLLIEPTGLGHPAQILKTLSSVHYDGVLSLRASLCLVDARKLTDIRYTENDNFNDQLRVADLLLATKCDLYQFDELAQLTTYLELMGLAEIPLLPYSSQWSLSDTLAQALNTPSRFGGEAHAGNQGNLLSRSYAPTLGAKDLDAGGFDLLEFDALGIDARKIVRSVGTGDGGHSCGWRFSPELVFDFYALLALIRDSWAGLALLRLKAVMITEEGIAAFNRVDGELTVIELDDALDSRLEIIAATELDWTALETQLLECLV
jgi:G3E family GTPase